MPNMIPNRIAYTYCPETAELADEDDLDNVNQFFDKAKEASKKLDADAKSSWENKVE